MRVRGKFLAAEPSTQPARGLARGKWFSSHAVVFVSRDEAKTVAWETTACKLSYITLVGLTFSVGAQKNESM